MGLKSNGLEVTLTLEQKKGSQERYERRCDESDFSVESEGVFQIALLFSLS